jgi:hypothetical protein
VRVAARLRGLGKEGMKRSSMRKAISASFRPAASRFAHQVFLKRNEMYFFSTLYTIFR